MLGNEYANKKKTMYQLEKFHLLLLFLSFACEMSKLSFHKISNPVSYTHLRAHETEADLVCRLLLEKKK